MRRQLEASRRACGRVAASREMAVAVRVAPARSDVCRVQHVAVDELHFVDDALVEVWVALFDVFAPEVEAFEEFGAAL